MELWDLYDVDRRSLNRTHPRGTKLNPGEFHVVVEIWTVSTDNKMLLTLRDPSKEEYPLKWECTGGSVLAGETSKEGAVRELKEETGIIASEDELILLGIYTDESAFYDTYFLRRDFAITELTMQEGETVEAKWVSVSELEAMKNDLSLALPLVTRLDYFRKEF